MTIPLLSICIPAYNRPEWLKRAILSILTTPIEQQPQIELIVSDDSTIPECAQVVDELVVNWHGKHRYHHNAPSLGMAANWNNCILLASGEYVLILHDDDYLEAGAPGKIIQTLQQHPSSFALLFGVNVVTPQQKIRKRQVASSFQYLNPDVALKEVLTDSSFIRFPGMVVQKELFQEIGYFDTTIGEISDIHMWIRILQKCGILCVPIMTANYTVHANALTMKMFNIEVLKRLEKLFEEVKEQNWLPPQTLEQCKSNYLHQFILAGSIRYIRLRQFNNALEVFNLFNQIKLQKHRLKIKWIIIKNILRVFLNLQTLFTFGQQSSEV